MLAMNELKDSLAWRYLFFCGALEGNVVAGRLGARWNQAEA